MIKSNTSTCWKSVSELTSGAHYTKTEKDCNRNSKN